MCQAPISQYSLLKEKMIIIIASLLATLIELCYGTDDHVDTHEFNCIACVQSMVLSYLVDVGTLFVGLSLNNSLNYSVELFNQMIELYVDFEQFLI